MREMHSKKTAAIKYLSWTGIIACMIVGALYIIAVSPLNPKSLRLPDIDSSIFIYFGYGIHAGKVPYVDMIDHKGPLLWTIQWLGLFLGNWEMTGIWYLEWIMMTVDLLLLFLCARFFIKNKLVCLLAVGLSVEPIVYLLEEGNYSEEWSLPFILFSLYIFIDYFVKDKLSRFKLFLCGMCMGAVLCIRPNMLGVWIGFAIAVLVRLVMKKQWRLIGRCLIWFCLGIGAVILPYVVYYACRGALKDMWEWSIARNVGYVEAGSSGFFSPETMGFFLKKDILLYLPVFAGGGICLYRRRFDWIWANMLFYAVSLLLCTLGGRTFPHYAIVMIPCLIIPVSYVLGEIESNAGKYRWIAFILLMIVLAKAVLIDGIRLQNSNIRKNFSADENNDSVVEYILENTEETDPILVMSLNAYYYDATKRFANTKYFIQHYMYDYDYSLYETVMDGIRSDPPKVIIMRKYNVDGDPWGEWMMRFYQEMCGDEAYSVYETDFFVAFNLKGQE